MRQKLNVALLHHFVKVGGETQLSVAAQRQPPPTHRTPHASNHPCTHAPTLSFRPQRSVAEESAFPSSTENPSCKAQAQADEIPPRPKGLRRNDKRWRGCEDTRMIQPLNTNKSSPRSRGGGSLICRQNCWQKPPLNLQADEIPPRPMGVRRNDKRWRGASCGRN
jgi:hypothetical protein